MKRKNVSTAVLGLLCAVLCLGIVGCKERQNGGGSGDTNSGGNGGANSTTEMGGLEGEFTLTSMFSANNGNIAVQDGKLTFYKNGFCEWKKEWWDMTTSSSFSGSVAGANGLVYSLENGEVKVYQAGYSDVNHIGTFTYDGKHTLTCTYDKITMKWGGGKIEYLSDHHYVGEKIEEDCYKKQLCDVCNEWVKEGDPDSDRHEFVETERVEATCEKKGEVTHRCAVCGYEKWEDLPEACQYDEGVCLTCGGVLQGKKITLDIGFSVQVDGVKLTIFGEGDLSYLPTFEGEILDIPNILSFADPKEVVVSEGITGLQGICSLFSSLEKVTLPNTLKTLDRTFIGCEELTAIELPDSLTSIGAYTFYECKKLQSIVAKNVTEIGEGAFGECWALSSIDFIKAEKIGENAFYNCNTYYEENSVLKIGSTLKSVGNEAFGYCSFATIYFYGTEAEWEIFAALCEAQEHWALIEADEIVIVE